MTEQQRIAGSLWPLVQQRHREALASGALQPIETGQEFLDDGGVRFVIRVAANLTRKAAAQERHDPSHRAGGPPPNPFLPHEPALFVADLTDTHRTLLNKFNVLDPAILILALSTVLGYEGAYWKRSGLGVIGGGSSRTGTTRPGSKLRSMNVIKSSQLAKHR